MTLNSSFAAYVIFDLLYNGILQQYNGFRSFADCFSYGLRVAQYLRK